MSRAEYLEVKVDGRTCYVTEHDLRLFYGLAGNIDGKRKTFAELPEEAFIVRIDWSRKRAVQLGRQRLLEAKGGAK